MGRLGIAVAECNYKEIDRQIKEHLFIASMTMRCLQVIHKFTAITDTTVASSKQVLTWAR